MLHKLISEILDMESDVGAIERIAIAGQIAIIDPEAVRVILWVKSDKYKMLANFLLTLEKVLQSLSRSINIRTKKS